MTTVTKISFATLLLIQLTSISVSGLSCAQCVASDSACRGGNVLPRLCPGGEHYCFIIRLYVAGAQGTYRGCINDDANSGCRPTTLNQTEGTYCISVCHWDGCNSSRGTGMAIQNRER